MEKLSDPISPGPYDYWEYDEAQIYLRKVINQKILNLVEGISITAEDHAGGLQEAFCAIVFCNAEERYDTNGCAWNGVQLGSRFPEKEEAGIVVFGMKASAITSNNTHRRCS